MSNPFQDDCPQKDLELERSVGKWLEMVAGKKGKDESFERWIQDGTVLAKVNMAKIERHDHDGDGRQQKRQG